MISKIVPTLIPPPINIIDIYREGLGRFLGSFVATALVSFPNVYVFSSSADGPTEDRDTFVVACSLRPLDIHDLGDRDGDYEFEGVLFAWSEDGVHGGQMETAPARPRCQLASCCSATQPARRQAVCEQRSHRRSS